MARRFFFADPGNDLDFSRESAEKLAERSPAFVVYEKILASEADVLHAAVRERDEARQEVEEQRTTIEGIVHELETALGWDEIDGEEDEEFLIRKAVRTLVAERDEALAEVERLRLAVKWFVGEYDPEWHEAVFSAEGGVEHFNQRDEMLNRMNEDDSLPYDEEIGRSPVVVLVEALAAEVARAELSPGEQP